MDIKKIVFVCTLLIGATAVYAEDIVSRGQLFNVNIDEGFLAADDASYAFDHLTQVYDARGQIRSLRSLRPGQRVELYLRQQTGTFKPYPNRVLDKIIYFSK